MKFLFVISISTFLTIGATLRAAEVVNTSIVQGSGCLGVQSLVIDGVMHKCQGTFLRTEDGSCLTDFPMNKNRRTCAPIKTRKRQQLEPTGTP